VKKRDLKLIGYVALIFGALFLALGIFTFSYSKTYPNPGFLCMYQVYPYAKYSAGLLGMGIVLVTLGSLSVGKAHYESGTQD